MKLHLANHEGNHITACRDGAVYVNGEAYRRSLLVFADKIVAEVALRHTDDLEEAALERIAQHSTAGMVVLLGSGDKSPPINHRWQIPFVQRGAILEIMSLRAACRTYNYLNADGRVVMAILLLDAGESA